MTERYGSGYGEEGSQRPSGRGAVTERLAGQDRVNEIDLTDETTERESSGAFEPASPGGAVADPPADTGRTGSSNSFAPGWRIIAPIASSSFGKSSGLGASAA